MASPAPLNRPPSFVCVIWIAKQRQPINLTEVVLIVGLLAFLAIALLGFHLYTRFRLSPRQRWLKRYDQRLKRNHPFFI